MTTPESSENRETVGSGTAESVAATERELVTLSLPEGSYVIERYKHEHGVQWIVANVQDGELRTHMVFDTRREAAQFVAVIRG